MLVDGATVFLAHMSSRAYIPSASTGQCFPAQGGCERYRMGQTEQMSCPPPSPSLPPPTLPNFPLPPNSRSTTPTPHSRSRLKANPHSTTSH